MQPIVGIDASRYPGEIRTGTETYSRELLDAMARLAELPFAVRSYVNRADAERISDLARLGEVRNLPFPRLWTHGRLSGEMLRHRPDLLFVPSHVVPLVHPRAVVTIHDLGYLHEPDAHPVGQRKTLDLTTRWNARAASQIIAISETTKSDLTRSYGTSADKISVIHHGISDVFAPAAESEITRVRSTYSLPDHFVLAVGTIQPRKNLARLAQAVAAVRADLPDLALVVAGKQGWMADSVLTEVRAALPQGQFRELGYVPLIDIPALYSAASVTALVSSYEGFGLPVIEAMACGSPVVISDAPALTEIAGGCALVAEARSVPGIADALKRVLTDPGTAARVVASGRVHSSTFTWDKTARKTVDLLERVLENRTPR